MWLVNSVMSKQWSFNWIYIFGMWAVLQEGTSGRWAKILLMWTWKSIRFLCTFSRYNDNRVHIVSCEYSPSDHSGHYIRTPGWQSHPEGQIQSEQHDECFFFFFFLKMNMYQVSLLTWDHDFGLNSSNENCSIITGGVAASTTDDCPSHEIGVSLKQNWCLLSAQVWAPRTSGQNFQSEI